MSEIIRVDETTEKTMTSVEFAKLSDREHKDIIKSIEALNKHLLELDKGIIPISYYKANNGAEYKQYILTRDNAELIAMKMDTKVMIKIHEKFKELQIVKSPMELVLDSIKYLELEVSKQKEKNLLLETKLEENAPKVAFAETVANSADVLLVREYAKILRDKEGIKIGGNRLFKWFRDKKYLNNSNEPYQAFMDYFKIIETTTTSIFGTRLNKTTKITGKGQLYFLDKLKKEFKRD